MEAHALAIHDSEGLLNCMTTKPKGLPQLRRQHLYQKRVVLRVLLLLFSLFPRFRNAFLLLLSAELGLDLRRQDGVKVVLEVGAEARPLVRFSEMNGKRWDSQHWSVDLDLFSFRAEFIAYRVFLSFSLRGWGQILIVRILYFNVRAFRYSYSSTRIVLSRETLNYLPK